MKSDQEALQGLWEVVSMIHGGQTVGHSDTHWEFDGDRVKQIIPTYVDGGDWAVFVLDSTTTPKRIDTTHQIPNRDGTRKPLTFKECYELSGDTLRVGGSPLMGKYPAEISDAISVVTTLTRYNGPRPKTKQASNQEPVQSAILGTVKWNDNNEAWEATAKFASNQKVNISLMLLENGPENTIAQGEALVEWARSHDEAARKYAAKEMTSLAEDWRDPDIESDEVTAESFATRIKLSELSMEASGEAILWYSDDAIFGGHIIAVSVDADRNFTDVQIMG